MKNRRVQQTTIIGGADGPVSVFIAGKGDDCKISLKERLRNQRYQMLRKRVEKKIQPGAHTKEELIAYARETYDFLPVSQDQQKYVNEKKCVRERIICQYRPELLTGESLQTAARDISDDMSLWEFHAFLQERERNIKAIPEEEVPMDFQMYELVIGKGHLEIAVDFCWDIFSVSYGGDRKQMKRFRRIAQDLYSYYGVTEEDIKNKTERYSALVCALADF